MDRGPLGSSLRFQLIAARPGDSEVLKGLGTYGFIRNPAGFLVGAASAWGKYLEDYGYAMESLVLAAADLGLGTCWLGGSFTRRSFSRRIELSTGERIPAVASVGVIADLEQARRGWIRRLAGGAQRLPWGALFFDEQLGVPLAQDRVGAAATALEMVRLAPSASNRQPWRVVRQGGTWHFLIQRTPGYNGRFGGRLRGREDLQRVDMGIAMCHFGLACGDLGIGGRWVVRQPALHPRDRLTEYVVSWEG